MLPRLARLVPPVRDAVGRRDGVVDPAAAGRLLAVLAADHPLLEGGGEDRLGDVADAFGLSDLDALLLTVAAAPELDPTFATAYAMLQGDPAAVRPSVALALELAGADRLDPQARDRLAAGAPLRAYDLLDVPGDAPFPLRPLRVPERVAGFLAGEDRLDPLVEALLVAPVPVTVPEVEELRAALRRGRGLVWVTGAAGTAGLGVAAAAFAALDAVCLAVDLRRRPSGVPVADAVRTALREAGLLLSGLVVAGADLLVPDGGPDVLRRLERSPVPVVALATEDWDAEWLPRVPQLLTAPVPDPDLRAGLWREQAGVDGQEDEPGWASLVGLRLTPEQIAKAARHAVGEHAVGEAGGPGPAVAALRESARLVASSGLEGSTRSRPRQTFADLVLPPSTLEPLREIVQWVTLRDTVLRQGPVGGKHGRGRGVTALFTGPPGTGKTLAAHVVAGELGLDLHTVDLSVVVDKYIGETEKHLERVLTAAEDLNAVLLFDEADALFGPRADVHDARDRYANQEIAYLLQRIEDFAGIAVLTTNVPGNIDAAFARRLNFVVPFPDPDRATRESLWRTHLSALAGTDGGDPVDVPLLAQLDVAGGVVRNVVLTAAYSAAQQDVLVGMRHLVDAAEREYRKMGRLAPRSWPGT